MNAGFCLGPLSSLSSDLVSFSGALTAQITSSLPDSACGGLSLIPKKGTLLESPTLCESVNTGTSQHPPFVSSVNQKAEQALVS